MNTGSLELKAELFSTQLSGCVFSTCNLDLKNSSNRFRFNSTPSNRNYKKNVMEFSIVMLLNLIFG